MVLSDVIIIPKWEWPPSGISEK